MRKKEGKELFVAINCTPLIIRTRQRETHAERVRDGEVLLASEGREGGADDATDGRTVTIREIGGGGGGGGGDVCSDDNDGG